MEGTAYREHGARIGCEGVLNYKKSGQSWRLGLFTKLPSGGNVATGAVGDYGGARGTGNAPPV